MFVGVIEPLRARLEALNFAHDLEVLSVTGDGGMTAWRMEPPTALAYFASLVGDDPGISLLEAAIAIAQDDHPDLDPTEVITQIEIGRAHV